MTIFYARKLVNSSPDQMPAVIQVLRLWVRERTATTPKLLAVIAALTPQELSLIRRQCQPEMLRQQLYDIHVSPRW
jgi:hypothetical protein